MFKAITRVTAIATAFGNFNEVVETVTIETENGPVRINASDYNPDVHTLVDGEESIPPMKPVVNPAPVAPVEPAVAAIPPVPPVPVLPVVPAVSAPLKPALMQEGAKWFVVDMNADNTKIADTTGYPSKKKAEEALKAL